MNEVAIVGALVVGALLGAGLVWLALRGRAAAAAEAAVAATRAELQGKLVELESGARHAAAQLEALRSELEQARLRGTELEGELRETGARRAAAEAEWRAASEQLQTRIPQLDAELLAARKLAEERGEELRHLNTTLGETRTLLEQERRQAQEKLALIEQAEQRLKDAFAALASHSLQNNNQQFIELAQQLIKQYQATANSDMEQRRVAVEQLVKPISERLQAVDTQIRAIEKERVDAFGAMRENLGSLAAQSVALQRETQRLTQALRAPQGRGRWGEIQLQRLVEMAGMLEHCDFTQQSSQTLEDGSRLRPDMIIKLPSERVVPVDAKAPLKSFLDALELEDGADRTALLADFARHICTHVDQLGGKAYWDQFKPSPDFTVLFLPGEHFLGAALEQRPDLIEYAHARRIVLATPTTLIALLRAVAYGWRHEALAQNAEEVAKNGRELYERIATLGEHFTKLGGELNGAVKAYNSAVGTLESRVLPSARRFRELSVASDKELPALDQVTQESRTLTAPELTAPAQAAPELTAPAQTAPELSAPAPAAPELTAPALPLPAAPPAPAR